MPKTKVLQKVLATNDPQRLVKFLIKNLLLQITLCSNWIRVK